MTTQKIITLVCDLCGRDESEALPVATHAIAVDRASARVLEACGDCWPSSPLDLILDASRRRRP